MKKTLLAIILLAVVVVVIVLLTGKNKPADEVGVPQESIRAGYIIYPPLMERSGNGDLSGVSYDIVQAIGEEMGVQIDWTEEVGWGTALEGLNTNRYDVLGTQMWPNEAREKVATFSNAPMNSVLYPYVKAGENRFSGDNLEALNSSEVRISAVDGELAVFIAQEDYPEAQLNTLPQLASYAEVFLNVVQDKADVSFNEPSAAEDFLASQPNTIERLGDTPVRSFGNSFAFSKDDGELLSDWNQALRKLMRDGTIESILEKHGVSTHYQLN